jgi:MoaA/NifB/PqqE/SkfB family radical SAM enzyme
MARLILELTNRCDLRCPHCFGERHAATGDLSLAILDRVLAEGSACGIDHLCFSGGEPTLHRHFAAIVERTARAGYDFSFVTNGRNFPAVASLVTAHRDRFRGVTFSLDGAREATHDRSRGPGSYRRVMRGASVCFFKKLPFTFNFVLTSANREEIDDMVDLAARLGSRGIRFGHLMFTPENTADSPSISPAERREVESHIWDLRTRAPIPVDIAAGYFSESPFFPCGPLELEEYNLDYQGNLTLCCHLSGFAGPNVTDDIMGNLHDIPLAEACQRFQSRVATYLADKRARVSEGAFGELDHFPCWYCVKYLGKVHTSNHFPAAAWLPAADHVDQSIGRRLHVLAGPGTAGSGCR